MAAFGKVFQKSFHGIDLGVFISARAQAARARLSMMARTRTQASVVACLVFPPYLAGPSGPALFDG